MYKIIKVTKVAIGVGIEEKLEDGTYSQLICSTLFDTGDDEKDAKESNKWAKIICDALNKQNVPYDKGSS